MTTEIATTKRKQTEETALAPQSLTPAQMLTLAVQQDAPVEKLDKLMDLQERWERNEARKAFEAAMVAFSAKVPAILKTRTVDFTTAKGRTHYTHAGLPETVGQIQALMAECQLSRRWQDEEPKRPGNIRIRCIVSHILGHSESFAAEAPPDESGNKNAAQSVASIITYLRRTTLFSVLGLVAKDEVDDDGAGSAPPAPPAAPVSKSALTDPEEATKRQFLSACRKKMGDPRLSTAVVAKLFTAAQQQCGSAEAQKCLDFIDQPTTVLNRDGTISVVDEGYDSEPVDLSNVPEWEDN